MIAADSSVIVAASATWHERHAVADAALVSGARLIAQCAIETYAVLTRLPHPHRVPPEIVAEFLSARFAEPYLMLEPEPLRDFLTRCPELGIHGGATYDAIVGATAASAGATLLSLDERALRTYERCGATVRVLG